jgi:hypothetical protein
VYFRASVEVVPFAEYFVNSKNPFLKYLDFLLPILEPSLDQICLWASYLLSQSQNFSNPQSLASELSPKIGQKETDATDAAGAVDTSHPRLWRTEITCVDEPQLHGDYSIPPSVKLRFDTKNKGTMVHENEHEVYVYEDMFEVGFRFPFPRVVREMLCLHDSLAEGPWRGTRTVGSRIFEHIQIIEESQV